MKQFLIYYIATLSLGAFAAENEAPKLEPVPKPVAAIPKTNSPEQDEIAAMNAEYVAAFKSGDPKILAGFYAEDADQTDGEGNVVLSGRAAIERQLKAYLGEHRSAAIALNMDSIRQLAPGVAMEKGEAVVTQPGEDPATTNYLAIHVKRDGKWLIAHLTETPSQTAPSPSTRLQELAWMVGSWKDKSSDAEVITACKWAANNAFLTRSFSAKSKDRGELQGTEIMGWDPIQGNIRSWIFDSEGGFTESIWTRDGNRWLIQAVTTLPDGRKASSHNTITHLSDASYTWESSNRILDGELRPNIDKIEIDRVKTQD